MKLGLLQHFIADLVTTPSHDTFRGFFSIKDSTKLEKLYRDWAHKIQLSLCSTSKRHIAILKNNPRKLPLSRKRMAAGWDDNFMKELLGQFIEAYNT